MKTVLNGNGNGNGHGAPALLRQLEKKAAKSLPVAAAAVKESRVTFQTADAVELSGAPVRVTRHLVAFELYNPAVTPRLSEALTEFKIILQGQAVYSGRATVRNIVDAGTKTICEATLKESDWTDLKPVSLGDGEIAREFKEFLNDWQKLCRVQPEFKVVIADMQTFLQDLRLWLERMELRIQTLPKGERSKLERTILDEVSETVVPFVNSLFEKFECIVADIEEDHRPTHGNYMRQHLHHLVLSAPFALRTFEKPLGYAGDFEMVNMMTRNDYEGGTLFGKVVHAWFVRQAPALAHRNRIEYLTKLIEGEAYRISKIGGVAKVYNFACGPAVEIQKFLRSAFSENVELTLADFNSETLEHVTQKLTGIKNLLDLRTVIRFQKKNVYQLVKDKERPPASGTPQYHLIYCAGLFDYLPDDTCTRLMKIFYSWLVPGGLMVVTNVTPSNPMRHGMENLLDWHLIYRTRADMQTLWPNPGMKDEVVIRSDDTGVNLFMEIRKQANV